MIEPNPVYDALMRERYGDLASLSAEIANAVPERQPATRRPPRTDPTPTPVELTPEATTYAAEHRKAERWLRHHHPDWEPRLALVDGGRTAHVITARQHGTATAVCGRVGRTRPATDSARPCRSCTP